ncbi:MAG: hypothetical protein HQL24_03820 [Candidatus Omnitrophica bacterium]|nr:hypothetical protein [Candidatus Omnitrophota bacterium]
MNRIIAISILGIISLCLFAPSAFSESKMDAVNQALEATESSIAAPAPNPQVVEELNQKLYSLTEENQRLQKQYQVFESAYMHKQQAILQYQSEIKKAQGMAKRFKAEVAKKNPLLSEAEKFENELMIKKSRQIYLKGQLLDMDEKDRLLKMQLSDLRYQQEELALGAKQKAFEVDAKNRKDEGDVESLRTKLRSNLEKERDLNEAILAAEQDGTYAQDKIEEVRGDNDHLKQQSQGLARQKTLADQETVLLEKKQALSDKEFENIFKPQNDLKQKLGSITDELNTKYASLDKIVDGTVFFRNQQKELMGKIVEADKKNQALRKEVEDLKKKADDSSAQ